MKNRTGKNNKFLFVAVGIVVIALVCVVVKINFGSRKSTDNKKSEQKAQLQDSITGYTEQYFEDGILYVDDSYMRFCSNAANEDGLICARPNCKHQKSRTEECGAYVDNINTAGFAKRGDKIYYIGAEDTGEDYSLYSEDLEGQNRKKLVKIPKANYIFEALYHDNTVYIAYMYKNYTDDASKTTLGIYKYDTISEQGNVYFETKAYGFSFDGMVMGKDTLYMSYVCLNVSNSDVLKHKSDKYYERKHSRKFVKGLDVKSGKEKVSLDGYGNNNTLLYVSGKLFYNAGKNNLYYDENTGETQKISGDNLIPVKSTDKQYAYFMSYDKKTKKRIYLRYDTSNDKMNIIAQGDYILCAVYGDKVYLSNAEGEKTEYSYIALDDFVKGDITGVKKYKSMWG